ncbi:MULTISPECIES: adenosylcobinamide-GDP ribazoletransferase [Thermoanaerobacterium]|uniref:Adenosylcobinamide-GDP ribazoletransferase n=2 Tax=Thermoanaerobacterium TaxID=28895 RepID=W9E7P8_9THEO|nr:MULTISPECIES: adenosylcobinamide-GDP ribazoletransferase [Thermoanaerobacterium]AFK85096.1 Cobalamin synthase [Thermoanaerobacterium saccharolyticum JW/SL-YS485]ETO37522.1 cobalamin synthase [Thermoanaerobacterium aotearoense SCUT27]
MDEIKAFILSLQFMTRIPVNVQIDVSKNDFHRMVKYFPFVGGLIGTVVSLMFYASKNIFPREIAITIALASSYILTGAMHIDGFADTFDGLFSNRSRDRMLEIMRDSRLGTNGVLALVFLIILKILFLTDINGNLIYSTLILMPLIGRFSIILAAYASKSARGGEGLGGLIIGKISIVELILSLLFTSFVGMIFVHFTVLLKLLVISSIVTYLITKYISMRIGGMTGDTLGAVNEFAELVIAVSMYFLSITKV